MAAEQEAGVMHRGAARRRAGRGGGERGPAAAVAVLLLALVAGCSGGSGAGSAGAVPVDGAGGSGAARQTTPPPEPPARLAVLPRDGSTGVSPVQPVVVTAQAGTLTSVVVRNADGRPVRGALSGDRIRWTSTEPLGYDKTYSVSAQAANGDGKADQGGQQLHHRHAPDVHDALPVARRRARRSASASRSRSASTSRSRTRRRPSGRSASPRSPRSAAPGTGSATSSCTGAR